jgi:valyl-tRNA synthetase
MSLSKTWQPELFEEKWYNAWLDAHCFTAAPDSSKEPYTVVIPPPNVTGVLHMGHMLNNTIQDVLVRRARMQGKNACWVPGTDHASIATEAKVVKLLADQGIKKQDLSRDEFLGHAFEWKEKYGGIILQQLRKLGASCDWDRTHFTMDANYYRDVIQVFCDLYEQGYIYRGVRMVNWDPQAQTAVSDEEVLYKESHGKLCYVKYALEDGSGFLVVATTRPETIMGDVAIAVHPEDERYRHLVGKKVQVPLVNRWIPIIADDALDMEFGTGCLKVTPAHDLVDYEIGVRHHLPVIDVFNPDGTLSEAAGLFVGEDRFIARKKMIKALEEAGLLDQLKDYTNQVGVSERTNAVIEPRLSMQWFLKMQEFSKPALDAVLDGEVNLIPNKFVNTYKHWMENVRDWCLSRQLWWGHRIPAYYLGETNEFVVAPTAEEALGKAKAKTGNAQLALNDLRQDEDVLDTWASSWLWPISVFDGLANPENPDFKQFYPTNDLVTAPEILFFWVARMIMAGKHYTGKAPFKNVYLTGIVRDKQGRKMSKSLGNSPDPLDLIAQYGADGVRVGMLLCSPAGNDLPFDEKLCEQGRNFSNKLWNAFRLIQGWEVVDGVVEENKVAVEWFRNRLNQVVAELEDDYSKFRLSEALMKVYKLVWDDFCSWYLEWIKPAFGAPIDRGTYQATVALMGDLLAILHPFMPFITEELWSHLEISNSFLAISSMPTPQGFNASVLNDVDEAIALVSELRNLRQQKGLSPKESLEVSISSSATAWKRMESMVMKLGNTSKLNVVEQAGEGKLTLVVGTNEAYLTLSENINKEEEIQKILQEIAYQEGFLKSVKAKLSNEKFVAGAPEAVVANERKKLADAESKISSLQNALKQLQ